jgi:MYXO-CTERM domain-containing protein
MVGSADATVAADGAPEFGGNGGGGTAGNGSGSSGAPGCGCIVAGASQETPGVASLVGLVGLALAGMRRRRAGKVESTRVAARC